MGRFENAGRCPDCQSLVAGYDNCRVCGLIQGGPEVERLRGLLAEADQVLMALRLQSGLAPAPAPQPYAAPAPSVPDGGRMPSWQPPVMVAPLSRPLPPPQRQRTFPAASTPVILLLLGALSVFAAAVVFVTVSWSDLSLGAKAAILLGVTAVLGGIGGWGLKATLRGTTETFSGLFAIMVVLDFLAARSGGLAGLDTMSDGAASWTAAILLVTASLGFALPGVRVFGKLTSVELLAGAGLLWLSAMAASDLPGRDEFVALALGVVLLVVAAVAGRMALWTLAMISLVYAVGAFAASLVLVAGRVASGSTIAELWGHGDALGAVLWLAVFAVTASLVRLPEGVRTVAASAATLGTVAVLLRPLEGSSINLILVVTGSTAAVLAMLPLAVPRLDEPWTFGVRVAAAASTLLTAFLLIPSALRGLSRIGGSWENIWALGVSDHLGHYLDAFNVGNVGDIAGPLVLAFALLASALGAMVLTLRRLPRLTELGAVATVVAAVTLLRYDLTVGTFVLILIALTVASGIAALVWQSAALAIASTSVGVLAALIAVASPATTLWVALALTAVLVAASLRVRSDDIASVTAGLAVLGSAVSVVSAVELTTIRTSTGGDLVAALAAAAALLAQVRPQPDEAPLRQRIGLEVASVPVALLGILLATDDPAWRLPIAFTIYGAGLSLVALWRADRRYVGYAGGLFLAAASWVRLAGDDVSVIEAYTLPSAIALLVVGTVKMYRTDASSFVALTPGLSLAVVPSLLVALSEPTSGRALAVGLAGVVLVLIGAAERWAAPMVFGGGAAGLLLVVNLAPYAQALPRWVLFAVVGATLLYLGVTWERRLSNLRSLALSLERVR